MLAVARLRLSKRQWPMQKQRRESGIPSSGTKAKQVDCSRTMIRPDEAQLAALSIGRRGASPTAVPCQPMRMGVNGLKSAGFVQMFKATAGNTLADHARRAQRPHTAFDAIKTLVICSMVLLLASCSEPFSSLCTSSSVVVSDTKTIVLQTSVPDPVFERARDNQVIVIGKRAAEQILREREKELGGWLDPVSLRPQSDGPKTILEWLRNADPGTPIPVEKLLPPVEGVSLQTINRNLVVVVEYEILWTRAILRGDAMIVVDQKPLPQAIASWYSAHDDFGVTKGVRIGVGTRTLHDFCGTTPH